METEKDDRIKSSSWIPHDVTIEILSRLPAKSVVRFRCVSKLWSSISTSPQFIKSFDIHSSARPSLLLVMKEEDKRLFFSLPHHEDPQRCYTRVEKYQIMLPKRDPKVFMGKVLSSIRGLICFEDVDQVVIWNPTLRQHVVLPDPKLSRPLISFLGYDPIDDKYKVLCMSGSKNAGGREKPRVLTLGAQESWRITEPLSPGQLWWRRRDENIRLLTQGICLNGIIYFYRQNYDMLESFDVRSEKFKEIRKPKGVPDRHGLGKHVITSYHGRLAWLCCTDEIWVLTDPEKQEWSVGSWSLPILYTLPRMNEPKSKRYVPFCGVTDSEEMIFMQGPRSLPLYVYYHDFKKDTTRWVPYEGVADWHMDCDCFPNHIENLISLKNLF